MIKTLLLRFAAPLVVVIAAAAWFTVPYVDRVFAEWFRGDIEMRARLVMATVGEALGELSVEPGDSRLRRTLDRVTSDERLLAVLLCRPDGTLVYQSGVAPANVGCAHAAVAMVGSNDILRTPGGTVHVAVFPVRRGEGTEARALIVHDLSFVDRRQSSFRDYVAAFAVLSTLVIVLITIAAAWLLLRAWARTLISDIRGRRFLDDARSPRSSLPILSQVRRTLFEIEQSQRLEIEYHENWTPQALRHVVEDILGAPQVIVVSNREPYIHNRDGSGGTVVQYPASGMVTAIEPVIRACSGTWIAHGSGSADRDVVDRDDGVRVPPEEPSYTLRRVWLDAAEEDGYYYGFSNEGLWPLCHLAWVRPAFRPADWEAYVAVNAKFADVIRAEARNAAPLVLVQDFHLALVPERVRRTLPEATVAVFWHIPWPNAETFGVCPWKAELLLGLLAADILGFHTRAHCLNFLASVDRYVECQIDHERMTVTQRGHTCQVAAYPISIEWPPVWLARVAEGTACRKAVRERHGLPARSRIGVGVERWDFTKGIVERFLAIEALLERSPELRGELSFLQVAAPTRSRLPAYQALQRETEETAARINDRFGTADWKPIVLLGRHHEPVEVFELMRAADFCMVNSLNDGMNLVAKEFVAAREDEDGVLILSTYAGASRELAEALLINPFDIRETAEAMAAALAMPRAERRERMHLMRRTVKENNVYRWAGRMLIDAARIRQWRGLRRTRPEKAPAHDTAH